MVAFGPLEQFDDWDDDCEPPQDWGEVDSIDAQEAREERENGPAT